MILVLCIYIYFFFIQHIYPSIVYAYDLVEKNITTNFVWFKINSLLCNTALLSMWLCTLFYRLVYLFSGGAFLSPCDALESCRSPPYVNSLLVWSVPLQWAAETGPRMVLSFVLWVSHLWSVLHCAYTVAERTISLQISCAMGGPA